MTGGHAIQSEHSQMESGKIGRTPPPLLHSNSTGRGSFNQKQKKKKQKDNHDTTVGMDQESYAEEITTQSSKQHEKTANGDGANPDMNIEGLLDENDPEPSTVSCGFGKGFPKKTLSYKDVVSKKVKFDILFYDENCTWSDDDMEVSMENNGFTVDLNTNSVDEEEDPLCPVVPIPKKHVEKLRKKWNNSVIVSLLGKNIGFKVLSARVPSLWNLQGDYEVVDLEEGRFLFKFMMQEDYHNVLTDGPWTINNHYLIVRKWAPNFNPLESNRVTTALWVRLPRLPIEWFDERALFQIG